MILKAAPSQLSPFMAYLQSNIARKTGQESATEALRNLRASVRTGGSLYASDWASEVMRMAFLERVNFVGDDLKFGHSRVGVENERQAAQIMDPGLQLALGTSSIRINLNLPLWSVLEEAQHQPPDLRGWCWETCPFWAGKLHYQLRHRGPPPQPAHRPP